MSASGEARDVGAGPPRPATSTREARASRPAGDGAATAGAAQARPPIELVLLCEADGALLQVTPPTPGPPAWPDLRLPGATVGAIVGLVAEVAATGRPAVIEAPAGPAGSGQVVECTLAPVPVPVPDRAEPGPPPRVLVVVREVTDRRCAQEALRESERRFRLLADNASDMVTRHDPKGQYTYVSPACRTVVGFDPARLVGRSPYEFIHPDDLPEVHRAHQLMLAGTDPSTVAFRGLRRDGTYVWLEATARAVRDPETGQVEEIHCTTRDITRRKQDEQELRESREVLQSVLDNSPAVVSIKDLDGRYLLVNRRYETLFDAGREAFVGRTDFDLLPAEQAAALRANDHKVLQAGHALEFEEHVTHGGARHTYLSVKFPLADRDGTPYAVCAISTEITERIRAGARLRETSAMLRSILDNMADAVIAADEDDRFLEYNPAARRMFGDPPGHLTRTEWAAQYGLFLPDGVTPFSPEQIPLARTLRGESVNDVEIFVRRPGRAEALWVLVNGRPLLADDGRPRAGLVVCRDITERKSAEERLRLQNLRLQEAAEVERQAHDALKQAEVQLVQAEKLRGLGLTVAGVAHEVNNPLAFVSNNMAVLQRDVLALRRVVSLYREADPVLAAHAPEALARVREVADAVDLDYGLDNLERLVTRTREGLRRIQQIVKDLKDFARADEDDVQAVDLNVGITSTVNIIQGLARHRGVEVVTDLHPLPKVTCHPGKINQVVMNLLSNAIDACAFGGRVVVHSALTPEADGVVVRVSDNGQGIAPEIRDRIFDPFFTTKPVGQGTGLGLSISYGIVKGHGGHIRVEPVAPHGASFTVTLPLSPPTAALPAP